jgi:predicted phage terminase large subunit-like protein
MLATEVADVLRRTITENKYIPGLGGNFPSKPQALCLSLPCREILYGGAAGGGKSASALAGGLQYVDDPDYHALLLRRSYPDLEKPGGLIPLSVEWLSGKKCKYDQTKHRWHFPSGATLSFGHAANLMTLIQDYQGSSFGYIAPDELTQWPFPMYRFLFRSLRAPRGVKFPLRMRPTSNPGGEGHEWVKARFIDGQDKLKRLYIPAKLEDNPGLDKDDYEKSLNEMDPVMRRQLRHGDWEVRPEGTMFRREWFKDKIIDRAPAGCQWVRYWDLAATKEKPGKDPDWCAGCLLGTDGMERFYVGDMQHFRESPRETEARLIQTAKIDGVATSIRIEREPGAAGKLYVDHVARLLSAFDVRGIPSSADKVTRARPASAACERGDVFLVRGGWVMAFLDELCAFPNVQHDDQVDGFSGGYAQLAREPEPWEERDVTEAISYGSEN